MKTDSDAPSVQVGACLSCRGVTPQSFSRLCYLSACCCGQEVKSRVSVVEPDDTPQVVYTQADRQ